MSESYTNLTVGIPFVDPEKTMCERRFNNCAAGALEGSERWTAVNAANCKSDRDICLTATPVQELATDLHTTGAYVACKLATNAALGYGGPGGSPFVTNASTAACVHVDRQTSEIGYKDAPLDTVFVTPRDIGAPTPAVQAGTNMLG